MHPVGDRVRRDVPLVVGGEPTASVEAGMAKPFAFETAMQIALNAVRIHGGYGYSTEFDIERYFRDAPLVIVGEGTNEIQRNVIASQLVKRGGLDARGSFPS
ncbi:acyl-CoA dehydrogenase family protein [Streptomyces europaeiscabiei]|nr:acyl-CoA dehydrogenase family protein [Streptomyces europaeiscabiei]